MLENSALGVWLTFIVVIKYNEALDGAHSSFNKLH